MLLLIFLKQFCLLIWEQRRRTQIKYAPIHLLTPQMPVPTGTEAEPGNSMSPTWVTGNQLLEQYSPESRTTMGCQFYLESVVGKQTQSSLCILFLFFFLLVKDYLCEGYRDRQGGRKRQRTSKRVKGLPSVGPLPKDCNSQRCSGLKSGRRSSSQVSEASDRDPNNWAVAWPCFTAFYSRRELLGRRVTGSWKHSAIACLHYWKELISLLYNPQTPSPTDSYTCFLSCIYRSMGSREGRSWLV